MVKPYRPIPSGLVSREEALGLAWLLASFSIARAFTISTFFGLIVLTLIFFAVFYSLPPFSPRKVNALLNVGWMAFSRGFLPMFAVWSVYGDINTAMPYSILAFLWVMGLQSTKDIQDLEGDIRFGIKTIPGSYGLAGQIALMSICSLTYVFCALMFKLYLMLLVIPLVIIAIINLRKQTSMLENTVSWIIFYLGLGLIYILMFINIRLF